MTRLILLVFSLMILPAMAREQDHTCQGGHNCNEGGGNGPIDVNSDSFSRSESHSESSAIAASEGGEGGVGGSGGSVGDITITEDNPDDITFRNTPGLGGGAAPGNAGFRIAFPGFGFGMDLPWSPKDKKKLAIYDRLILRGNGVAATKVLCTTSIMEDLYTEGDCETSLGGGSDTGKN